MSNFIERYVRKIAAEEIAKTRRPKIVKDHYPILMTEDSVKPEIDQEAILLDVEGPVVIKGYLDLSRLTPGATLELRTFLKSSSGEWVGYDHIKLLGQQPDPMIFIPDIIAHRGCKIVAKLTSGYSKTLFYQWFKTRPQ